MRFVPHGEGDILDFVEAGIAKGNRPDLVGGGLMRSLGGWSEVVSQRRHGDRDVTDERILGSGDFVQRLLKEAETRQKDHFFASQRQQNIRELIATTCKTANLFYRALHKPGVVNCYAPPHREKIS